MKPIPGAAACFVNVAVFLLSVSNLARLLLLLTTVAAWWYLSDYYFAPWPWWMDRYAFMVCSFFVFLVMTAAIFWLGIRTRARRSTPPFDLLKAKPGPGVELAVGRWCELLRTIAGFHGGLWAEYWTWYRLRLEGIGNPGEMTTADSLPALWWFCPSAIPQWLALGCLPALWAVLLLGPLHTNVMERIARGADSHPQVIFDVRCSGEFATGSRSGDEDKLELRPVAETLARDPSGYQRSGQCANLTAGNFAVSSTPFPRVYRHLVVRCGERCGLRLIDGVRGKPRLEVPVVSGEAGFKWLQYVQDPPLKMMVSLVRQDGSPLDTVSIEP